MSTHRLRIWLGSIAGMLIFGAAAVLVWAFAMPVVVSESPAPPRPVPVATIRQERRPSLEALRAAFAIDLNRPLVDPAPRPATVTMPMPTLMLKLAGTVIEPGNCRALLQLPDGRMELKRVGDQSSGAQVMSIEQNSVTMLFQGKPVIIRTDRKRQGR